MAEIVGRQELFGLPSGGNSQTCRLEGVRSTSPFGRISMRCTKGGLPLRAVVSAAGVATWVIELATGSKSKISVGVLKSGESAAKITWPLGSTAPGASSAPRALGMVGPATHVFVEGVYNAVLLLAP